MNQGTLVAKNSFLQMRQDELPYLANESSYYFALNATLGDLKHRAYGLSNEGSNRFCVGASGVIVGSYYIDERNQTLLLKEGDEFLVI